MSEIQPEQPEDPINADAHDWDEAGLPEQEDATEDQPLPADHPIAMGEFGSTGTDKEAGEPLDDALARERPDIDVTADAPQSEEEEAQRYPEDKFDDPRGTGAEERAVYEEDEDPDLP
ncbi:hypothetical protein [Nocardiopsis trehalosi]|jgi:hypothetical protein|uniref:hypothetical protein n=1 Tax=Nocardiopsis trehalosi TaxID=109329 RepID=UPI0008321F5C|nr:hypothetical protein [Nocardiopsis trehalosi]